MAGITINEFVEYINALKNGTYKCPFCSKEEFLINGYTVSQSNPLLPHIPGPSQMPFAARLPLAAGIEDNPLTANQRHTFFSITCSNCGHTDFFHQNQVERWFAARGKPKNG